MTDSEIYDDVRVKIQNVSPKWNGKIGIAKRWCFDSWYIVQVDDTELLLCTDNNEFIKV